jgi:hypothetical protein
MMANTGMLANISGKLMAITNILATIPGKTDGQHWHACHYPRQN